LFLCFPTALFLFLFDCAFVAMGRAGGRDPVEREREEREEDDAHQPLNFGKKLAHTDKAVRDRGFKVLRKWLEKHPDLEKIDYMKLWKGLYFAMWMADKRPVQQELCVNVALLVNLLPREKQGMWISCFWETMEAGWEKLDVHRISKYLLFLRIIIAEAFKALRLNGWDAGDCQELGKTFARRTVDAKGMNGGAPSQALLLHLMRIFWEELTPQLASSSSSSSSGKKQKTSVSSPPASAASAEVLLLLLEPFCKLAERCSIESQVRYIHEYILQKAPSALAKKLSERVLQGASRPDIGQKNREALYDTADVLEKQAAEPGDDKKTTLVLRAGTAEEAKAVADDAVLAAVPVETGKRRKRRLYKGVLVEKKEVTDNAPKKVKKSHEGGAKAMKKKVASRTTDFQKKRILDRQGRMASKRNKVQKGHR